MWEAYELENEDFLWTGIPFLGGIGGFQNAPCGVVSATAVCLSLRHRVPLSDKERAKQARHAIRAFSAKIVSEFNQHFVGVLAYLYGLRINIFGGFFFTHCFYTLF